MPPHAYTKEELERMKTVQRLVEELTNTSYIIIIKKGMPDYDTLIDLWKNDKMLYKELSDSLCENRMEIKIDTDGKKSPYFTISPMQEKRKHIIVCAFSVENFTRDWVEKQDDESAYKFAVQNINAAGSADVYTLKDFETCLNDNECFDAWYKFVTVWLTDEEYEGWFK